MSSPDTADDHGVLVYFLALLGAVVIGPLEAALGLAVYWLVDSETDSEGGKRQ